MRGIRWKRCCYIEHRDRKDWFSTINYWKGKFPFKYFDDSKIAKPQYVIEEINKQTKSEAIITTGVGRRRCGRRSFTAGAIPAADDHLGRAGHDGFRPPRGHGHRAAWGNPARPSSISTAMHRI